MDKRELMKKRLAFFELTTEFSMVTMMVMKNKKKPEDSKTLEKWGWAWSLTKEQCVQLTEEMADIIDDGLKDMTCKPAIAPSEAEKERLYNEVDKSIDHVMQRLRAKLSTWEMQLSLGIGTKEKSPDQKVA